MLASVCFLRLLRPLVRYHLDGFSEVLEGLESVPRGLRI